VRRFRSEGESPTSWGRVGSTLAGAVLGALAGLVTLIALVTQAGPSAFDLAVLLRFTLIGAVVGLLAGPVVMRWVWRVMANVLASNEGEFNSWLLTLGVLAFFIALVFLGGHFYAPKP
jgi:hypothetical protein